MSSSSAAPAAPAAAAAAQLLLTGGEDGVVKVWDVSSDTRSPQMQVKNHTGATTCVSWTHNNNVLASCGEDGYVILCRANGVELAKFPRDASQLTPLNSIAFSSQSRFIVSGGDDMVVNLWDLKKRDQLKQGPVKSFKGHRDIVTCVVVGPRDDCVASASNNGTVLIHSLVNGQLSATLRNRSSMGVNAITYSPFKSSYMAAADEEGDVNVWNTHTQTAVATYIMAHEAPASGCSFSKQHKSLVASVGLDKKLCFFDLGTKQLVKRITTPAPLTCISFDDNDGSSLAVGTITGDVLLYDLRRTKEPRHVIAAHMTGATPVRITSVSFAPATTTIKSPSRSSGSGKKKSASTPADSSSSSSSSSIASESPSSSVYVAPDPHHHHQRSSNPHMVSAPSTPLHPSASSGGGGGGLDLLSPIQSRVAATTTTMGDGGASALVNQSFSSPIPQGRPSTLQFAPSSTLPPPSSPLVFPPPSTAAAAALAATAPPTITSSSSLQQQHLYAPPSTPPQQHGRRMSRSFSMPAHVVADTTDSPMRRPSIGTGSMTSSLSPRRELMASATTATGAGDGGRTNDMHMALIRSAIDEALGEFRGGIRQDIGNLHLDMLRQFHLQQMEMRRVMNDFSHKYERLLEDVQSLKNDYEVLKQSTTGGNVMQ